ncbi:MAG: phosphotransferase [Anaerolineae bacterium]|nr:phosphotransferase [Anaerolineae bacterium]
MHPVLPILKSFVEPLALSDQLSQAYGLTNVRVQLIKATMRDVYEVSADQGRYVATIYSHRDSQPSHVFAEQVFTNFLMRKGAPVITTLPTQQDEYLVLLPFPEGSRFLALLPYIGGEQLPRQPSAEQIRQYGEAIARIHLAADHYAGPLKRPVYQTNRLLWEPFETIKESLRDRVNLRALRNIAEKIAQGLQQIPTKRPWFGMIHGDVVPSNALLKSDGSLTVIDFDLCGYGWRMYDVATFLNEAHYWRMGDQAEAAFLQGYESVFPIPQEQKQIIPLLGAARSIWTMGNAASHVDVWGSNVYLSQNVINGELQTLKYNLSALR